MTEVMKSMKILFNLATPTDMKWLSDKVMKASFTWKTVTIDEVSIIKEFDPYNISISNIHSYKYII